MLNIQKYVKIYKTIDFYISKGVHLMGVYKLTAFEPNGHKLIDEAFQANNDEEAKVQGEQLLKEKNLLDKTHRCTSPQGKLLLFHP